MMALDTNVLVRFLTKDDADQAQRVYRLFKQAETDKAVLYVPLLVVLEMIWVLQSVYGIADGDIVTALANLLAMPVLKFEQQAAIQRFIGSARANSSGLADLLIAHSAKASQCEFVLTFDKKAAGLPFFKLLTEWAV